jgi:hypothetical protein
MVILWSPCWLALVLIAQNPTAPTVPTEATTKIVRTAMSKGHYPWYDEKTDRTRSITLKSEPKPDPPASQSGYSLLANWITMLGFGLSLAVLVALLVWFWKIYEPTDADDASRKSKKHGEPSRIDSLPEGMEREFETSDPWDEAIRRRDRGDFAGAIICLFAHQLLTLSKLGLVRLAPGRTGRQLLKAVSDGELRIMVAPTLRLFEAVFYGHRSPTEAEFAVVWSAAEAFERRIAGGVAR